MYGRFLPKYRLPRSAIRTVLPRPSGALSAGLLEEDVPTPRVDDRKMKIKELFPSSQNDQSTGFSLRCQSTAVTPVCPQLILRTIPSIPFPTPHHGNVSDRVTHSHRHPCHPVHRDSILLQLDQVPNTPSPQPSSSFSYSLSSGALDRATRASARVFQPLHGQITQQPADAASPDWKWPVWWTVDER